MAPAHESTTDLHAFSRNLPGFGSIDQGTWLFGNKSVKWWQVSVQIVRTQIGLRNISAGRTVFTIHKRKLLNGAHLSSNIDVDSIGQSFSIQI